MDVRFKFSIFRQLKNFLASTRHKRGLCTELSSSEALIYRKNDLFTQEQKRQIEEIGRIEKIEVNVEGPPETVTLVMNEDLSTPFDCSKHISETCMKQSALALIDSNEYWDMHRPLTRNCQLKLLTFKDRDPREVNKAFWRSCSVILGGVIVNAFKENVSATLHSFPAPNVRTGSFVYDVRLGLNDWKPTTDELRILSGEMLTFMRENYLFERLVVDQELALQIFEGNEFKQSQIPSIAENNNGNITLYRVGKHIDISCGPMIGDTSFIGRCTVTAVHKLDTEIDNMYRFQGVALPKGFMLNHFAYGIIEERARKLNTGLLPGSTQYINRVEKSTNPEESNELAQQTN